MLLFETKKVSCIASENAPFLKHIDERSFVSSGSVLRDGYFLIPVKRNPSPTHMG